jgi:hypothetical protein
MIETGVRLRVASDETINRINWRSSYRRKIVERNCLLDTSRQVVPDPLGCRWIHITNSDKFCIRGKVRNLYKPHIAMRSMSYTRSRLAIVGQTLTLRACRLPIRPIPKTAIFIRERLESWLRTGTVMLAIELRGFES